MLFSLGIYKHHFYEWHMFTKLWHWNNFKLTLGHSIPCQDGHLHQLQLTDSTQRVLWYIATNLVWAVHDTPKVLTTICVNNSHLTRSHCNTFWSFQIHGKVFSPLNHKVGIGLYWFANFKNILVRKWNRYAGVLADIIDIFRCSNTY